MKKKYLKSILLIMVLSIASMPRVMALNYDSPCSDPDVMKAVKIIGYVIFIIKIVVPLILIVMGMMDFTKAVTSSDEKALRKALEALIRRFIAAIVIFILPTLLLVIVNSVEPTNDGYGSTESGTFHSCTKCLLNAVDEGNCK